MLHHYYVMANIRMQPLCCDVWSGLNAVELHCLVESVTAPFQFTYTGIILICIATKVMTRHEVPLFAVPASDPGGWFGFIQNNNTDADGRSWRKKPLHHTLMIAHINPVFDVNFRMVHCLSPYDGIANSNVSDYRARAFPTPAPLRWCYLGTVSTLNVRPSRDARKLIRPLCQGKTIRVTDRNRLLAVIGPDWSRTEN